MSNDKEQPETKQDGDKDKSPFPPPFSIPEKGMPAWLSPILSAVGSYVTSYILHFKPLKEKLESLGNEITKMREEIKELKVENAKYRKELDTMQTDLENITTDLENIADEPDYLPVKKPIANGNYFRSRI